MKKNYVFGGIGRASIALREKTGWTQTDLAEQVGCSFGTVSRWERHPDENMVVRKAFAQKFMALYTTHIRRERVSLTSIEMDDLEMLQDLAR